jgi:tight adherence protein C
VLLTLILGLALVVVAVMLVARGLSLSRVRTTETLGQIPAYGFTHPTADPVQAARPVSGALDGIAGVIGSALARRFGSMQEATVRSELMAAGVYSLSPRKFIGYRVLSLVCVPVAWLSVSVSMAASPLLTVLGLAFAVWAGWVAPLTIVRNRARRRLDEIDRALPDLIDLLVVTVEAGLGFSSSLQVAAERMTGALGNELRLTLQEQSMGLAINEALSNMLLRADSPSMRSFVRSILQGEQLGVSIGQIMRNLALEMRSRRRQIAQERAQKAPIKMLFPLILLIFPAIFVVLLAPAVFSFLDAFGGK